MRTATHTATLIAAASFLILSACSDRSAESTADARGEPAVGSGAAAKAPDNTGVNKRDRDPGAVTAQDQPENENDRQLAARVRQVIVADDALSTSAHNVKVITTNGVVTLRGPVKSEQERAAVAAKAQHVAGVQRVDNQLEVAAQ
jgi:hyperosmotically inducible periplasmic protein